MTDTDFADAKQTGGGDELDPALAALVHTGEVPPDGDDSAHAKDHA